MKSLLASLVAFLGFTIAAHAQCASGYTQLNNVFVCQPNTPAITSPTTASGTVGTPFSYQITATNSPTSFGATSLPSPLSVNTSTGLISGTPTATSTNTVGLSATNGSGTGTQNLALTIGSGGGGGVVTLDANSTAPFIANNTSTSTITFTNLTVSTAHSNYALVVQYAGNNNGVTSMTWGSQPLTRISSFTYGSPLTQTEELWGLVAPASGNKTLSVTLNGAATYAGLNATSWYGVNQTGGATTFYNAGHTTGTGTAMSIAVASNANDAVLEVDNNNSTGGPHAPLGTTLFNGGTVSPAGSYAAGAASVTLGWTAANSTTWGMLAAALAHS